MTAATHDPAPTTTPATAHRLPSAPSALDVVHLQTAKRFMTFAVPLLTLAVVLALSAVVAGVFYQLGSRPGTAEWVENSRSNPGVLWALPGFLGYYGVQSVATTFPLALTLGAGRRAFTAGTLLFHGLLAAYIALAGLVLLGVEKATGQWFVGLYLMDVSVLGGGDPWRLVAVLFLGSLAVMSAGAAFAAAWVRFGARGPMALALGTALVLAVTALLLASQAAAVAEAFELWWLAAAAVVVISLACAAQQLLLRRASVR